MGPDLLDQEELWALADEIRSRFWPENILPVDAGRIVEFRLHLHILPCRSLLSQTGLLAFLKRDLTGVVVDHDCCMDDGLLPRMHFSFAHEMGHYFIHRDLYLQLRHRSLPEWKDFTLNPPKKNIAPWNGRPMSSPLDF